MYPCTHVHVHAPMCRWEVVSPFSGIGSTAALLFVVAVSGVKVHARRVRRVRCDVCGVRCAMQELASTVGPLSPAPYSGCMHEPR